MEWFTSWLTILTTSNSFKSALKKYLKLTWLYLLFLWNTFPVLSYLMILLSFLYPPPPPPPQQERSLISTMYFSTILWGAWTDRDTNDIFAHCSLIFYFLDFKFSNFVCLSELHPLIWFFFKNFFRKKKNIQKTTQNALAPSIFIVSAIVLKLGTPLLHTQAQNRLLQNL